MSYRVNVDKGRDGTNAATIHAATSQDMRCQPWEVEVTDGGWFGPYMVMSTAERLALSMGVPRKNIHRCKICLKDGNPVPLASIGAGAAGMAAGAGFGFKVGGCGSRWVGYRRRCCFHTRRGGSGGACHCWVRMCFVSLESGNVCYEETTRPTALK